MANNRLLDSLPPELLRQMKPDLIPVKLSSGDLIVEDNAEIDSIVFPTSSLASCVVDFSDGRSIEATLIGADGCTGLAVFFGYPRSQQKIIVQIPGDALQMNVDAFRRHLSDSRLRAALGLYATQTLRIVGQSAGCVVFHPIEQRLARWLLMVQDAIEQDEFPLTQEYIGIMLGTHRPTVTIAEGILTKAGLVERRRGAIKLLDREGLEAASCECYEAQKLVD